jgi:hypothetical protein
MAPLRATRFNDFYVRCSAASASDPIGRRTLNSPSPTVTHVLSPGVTHPVSCSTIEVSDTQTRDNPLADGPTDSLAAYVSHRRTHQAQVTGAATSD